MLPPYRFLKKKDEKPSQNVPVWLLGTILPILLIAWSGLVSAQGSGVVMGQLANGTARADAESAAGLTVNLIIFAADDGTTQSRVAITDSVGQFHFTGLDTSNQITYRAQVEYQGIAYASEARPFPVDAPILTLDLTIYEITTQDPGMTAVGHHILLEFGDETLTVGEFMRLQNPSDFTYIGGREGITVLLSLPPQASNIAFQDSSLENSVVFADQGWALVKPLLPGETPILFSYRLPITGDDFDFNKTLAYPTSSFNLVIEDVEATIDAPGFTFSQRLASESGQYLHYTAQNFAKGEEISIHLSQIPNPSTSPENALLPSWAFLAFITLVMGGVLVWAIIRKPTVSPPLSKEELIRAIAILDDAFAAGQIEEKEYRRRRAQMKAQLIRLWPKQESGEGQSAG